MYSLTITALVSASKHGMSEVQWVAPTSVVRIHTSHRAHIDDFAVECMWVMQKRHEAYIFSDGVWPKRYFMVRGLDLGLE